MKPVVSVILLIGEGSRSSVMRSINCLLRQTACEPEIVAVNIGSEGYGVSVSLQEDYAENRQITFVSLLEDPGDNYRNYTLRYARGEYVCFMKGGEIWTEEKLERADRPVPVGRKASAVISNGVYTLRDGENTAGGTFFRTVGGDSSGDGAPAGDGPAGWMLRCPVITSGQVLYKLDALKEIGKFSSSFQCLSDLDAICRISRAGRVLFDPARNVNCEITDSLRKKRRRFLEYEKLLFDRLYIDRMLSDQEVLQQLLPQSCLGSGEGGVSRRGFAVFGHCLHQISGRKYEAALFRDRQSDRFDDLRYEKQVPAEGLFRGHPQDGAGHEGEGEGA